MSLLSGFITAIFIIDTEIKLLLLLLLLLLLFRIYNSFCERKSVGNFRSVVLGKTRENLYLSDNFDMAYMYFYPPVKPYALRGDCSIP